MDPSGEMRAPETVFQLIDCSEVGTFPANPEAAARAAISRRLRDGEFTGISYRRSTNRCHPQTGAGGLTNAGSNPTGAYFEVDPTPLPAGSLSLFPSVPSLSLAAGGPSSPVTVTLTPGGGFRGAANITVPGLPSGVSVVTPSPIPAVYVGPAPVQIVLNVQASASAASVSGAQFTIGAPPASPAPMTVTVSGTSATPPTITTSTLPNGWLNTAYTQTTFQATGGSGGYTWAVISGTLQSGLSLSSAGVLNGTPTVSGTIVSRFA